MATTTNFGWTTPDDTDLVKDGASAIRTLGSAIDTTMLDVRQIVQVVRATDAIQRTTTSTSYVDANLSVTITPVYSSSRLILVYTAYGQMNAGTTGDQRWSVIITDSSNTALSGAEGTQLGVSFGSTVTSVADAVNIWGYVEPGSTSALTYKVRFKSSNASNTAVLVNPNTTAQLYAIEVAA